MAVQLTAAQQNFLQRAGNRLQDDPKPAMEAVGRAIAKSGQAITGGAKMYAGVNLSKDAVEQFIKFVDPTANPTVLGYRADGLIDRGAGALVTGLAAWVGLGLTLEGAGDLAAAFKKTAAEATVIDAAKKG